MTAIYILLGVEAAIIAFLLWRVNRLDGKFCDIADACDDLLDSGEVLNGLVAKLASRISHDLKSLTSHLGLEFVDTPAKRELVEKGNVVE